MEVQMAKQKRTTTIIATGSIHGGRDEADLVRDSDPRGDTVVYQVNRTQRMIDRLFREKSLTPIQYDAASRLRDAWEHAGLDMPKMQAVDPGRPQVGAAAPRDLVQDEAAWQRYTHALQRLTRDDRRLVVTVIIHDEDPVAWGRRRNCLGIEMLKSALDKLARHWGLDR